MLPTVQLKILLLFSSVYHVIASNTLAKNNSTQHYNVSNIPKIPSNEKRPIIFVHAGIQPWDKRKIIFFHKFCYSLNAVFFLWSTRWSVKILSQESCVYVSITRNCLQFFFNIFKFNCFNASHLEMLL